MPSPVDDAPRRRRTLPSPASVLLLLGAPLLPAAAALQVSDRPACWGRTWSLAVPAPSIVADDGGVHRVPPRRHRSQSDITDLKMLTIREADFGEMLAGGERYEYVPLPDSMRDTTLWVGNLCEFVTDDALSEVFSEVSALSAVPACVARNPNASSRKYGFVTFPTVQEKETAIIRLSGRKLNGRKIKVEPIVDKPGQNRCRVPGKIVAYVLGFIPKEGQDHGKPKQSSNSNNKLQRISKGDVDRLSRGQPAKEKRRGSRSVAPPPRLQEPDMRAFVRAAKIGYVTLEGTGYRRGRKGSSLANIHRQWCDARAKPQIILCKASGGRPLDNVIVDLSPLRVGALSSDVDVNEFLVQWKADILTAAEGAGMTLKSEYVEDNTEEIVFELDGDDGASRTEFVITVDSGAWATEPISYLPAISLGVFEGERSSAKAMAKALSQLWQVPDAEEPEVTQDFPNRGTHNRKQHARERKRGGRAKMKTKMKGLRHHREKGRRGKEDYAYW